jgi:hypothetical protein
VPFLATVEWKLKRVPCALFSYACRDKHYRSLEGSPRKRNSELTMHFRWPTHVAANNTNVPTSPCKVSGILFIQPNSVITSEMGPNKLCRYKRVSIYARCTVNVKEKHLKSKYRPAGMLITVNATIPNLNYNENLEIQILLFYYLYISIQITLKTR